MKQQSNLILVLLCVLFAYLPACSNKDCDETNVVVEKRNLDPFHQLDTEGIIDLILEKGDSASVSIHAPSDIIKLVRTEVTEERLKVYYEDSNNKNVCNIKAYVTYTALSRIENSGTGDIEVRTTVETNNFSIKNTGTGDIEVITTLETNGFSIENTGTGDIEVGNLTAQEVSINMDGTGDIFITGTTNTLNANLTGTGDFSFLGLSAQSILLELTGSGDVMMRGSTDDLEAILRSTGDLNGFDLVSQAVTIIAQSTGDTEIFAEQTLEVTISGSGDVSYTGSPQITQNVTGSGDLINAN